MRFPKMTYALKYPPGTRKVKFVKKFEYTVDVDSYFIKGSPDAVPDL